MFVQTNTLRELRHYAIRRLGAAMDTSEAEAITRILLEDLLGIPHQQAVVSADRRLSESEMLAVHHAVKRIEAGEPVQYVTGKVEFMGLEIGVSPAVLIPRPETEELVDRLLRMPIADGAVLDACTGSGCIALALAKHRAGRRVVGVDISADALEVARANAVRNHVEVDWQQLDMVTQMPDGAFALVVSNPPYVPASELDSLHRNVADFEPHLALFVPDDNVLSVAGAIARNAWPNMVPDGLLAFEFHRDHCGALQLEMQRLGYRDVEVVKDLQGNNRFVWGRK
jgi:release factor glutamine methyltransferase